jgi:hypothetical protein
LSLRAGEALEQREAEDGVGDQHEGVDGRHQEGQATVNFSTLVSWLRCMKNQPTVQALPTARPTKPVPRANLLTPGM